MPLRLRLPLLSHRSATMANVASSTSPRATLGPQALPRLTALHTDSPALLAATRSASPRSRISSDADLAHWQRSSAHALLSLFIARLSEAAVGRATPMPIAAPAKKAENEAAWDGVDFALRVLQQLDEWTREIEPLEAPQRFGNRAFRTWGARLEERIEALHADLPAALQPYVPELSAYLGSAFGSWVRLDYGSGHELGFIAWICTLARLGAFGPLEGNAVEAAPQEEAGPTSSAAPSVPPQKWERRAALELIPRYLEVVWALQDRYGLEPAGSHGVWGLDDYQFVPYIIGAAQLRTQYAYTPSEIALPTHKPPHVKPSPRELLLFVPSHAPYANLFSSSIARIHALKRGAFHEHSPLLHDVSRAVPNWVKVHHGMRKMWLAEVLAKRPVVQHFVFGGAGFVWEGGEGQSDAREESTASRERTAATATAQPSALPNLLPPRSQVRPVGGAGTAAPWASEGAGTAPPWTVSRAAPPPTSAAMAPTGAPWASAAAPPGMAPMRAPWAAAGAPGSSGTAAPPPPRLGAGRQPPLRRVED